MYFVFLIRIQLASCHKLRLAEDEERLFIKLPVSVAAGIEDARQAIGQNPRPLKKIVGDFAHRSTPVPLDIFVDLLPPLMPRSVQGSVLDRIAISKKKSDGLLSLIAAGASVARFRMAQRIKTLEEGNNTMKVAEMCRRIFLLQCAAMAVNYCYHHREHHLIIIIFTAMIRKLRSSCSWCLRRYVIMKDEDEAGIMLDENIFLQKKTLAKALTPAEDSDWEHVLSPAAEWRQEKLEKNKKCKKMQVTAWAEELNKLVCSPVQFQHMLGLIGAQLETLPAVSVAPGDSAETVAEKKQVRAAFVQMVDASLMSLIACCGGCWQLKTTAENAEAAERQGRITKPECR